MTDLALERDLAVQGRVILALAQRALRVQLRRAQFLLPSFLLPLLLLAVVASGTSAAQQLPGFPSTGSYVGFVVSGTIMQGTLLAGLMAGIAIAGDIEGGFFDRLLSAPVHRSSIVLGRVLGTAAIGVAQAVLFLAVAFAIGADFTGGAVGILLTILLAALSASAAAGLGAALALRTGSLSLMQNLFPFVFVLLFTAPAFFPRALLSPVLEKISVVNPLSYVVEGMRAALFDLPALGSVPGGFAAGIGSVVLTSSIAVWAMRSRAET